VANAQRPLQFSIAISVHQPVHAPRGRHGGVIVALLNQKLGGGPQGNLIPRLYALAAAPSNGVFHDATPASSSVTGNCVIRFQSVQQQHARGRRLSGGLAGYALTTGYDQVTGLEFDQCRQLVATVERVDFSNLDQHGLTGVVQPGDRRAERIGSGTLSRYILRTGHGLLFGGWFTFDTTAGGSAGTA
jgi:hypothetical protein